MGSPHRPATTASAGRCHARRQATRPDSARSQEQTPTAWAQRQHDSTQWWQVEEGSEHTTDTAEARGKQKGAEGVSGLGTRRSFARRVQKIAARRKAMDLVISGGEDSLLESLSFDLPPSSSYVQQRRLVSYYPSGASTFSPSGVRVCRFTIGGGDGWLDPQSLRVYAKLANTHGSTALQLAGGPHCLFSRVRLFIGGTLVEDLDAYGRPHQLFRRLLMPEDWVGNDAIESGTQSYQEGAPGSVQPHIAEQQLAAGKYAMFNFAPLLGVMASGKYLPIRLSGGMQLELTLGDAADAVVAGSSTSYEIQEMSLRCAVAKLDGALESSFSQMMMSNRALTLRLNTYHTQSQALPAGNSEINIRSCAHSRGSTPSSCPSLVRLPRTRRRRTSIRWSPS